MSPCSRMGPNSIDMKEDNKMSTSSDSDSSGSGKSSKQRRSSRKSLHVDKNTDEYKYRRERNNIAVKKSRTKSKMKTQQTLERVNTLREENAKLESKIKLLTKELSFLKDLFLAHAGNAHGQEMKDVDWNKVLATEPEVVSLLTSRDCQNNNDSNNNISNMNINNNIMNVNGEAVQNDHKYTVHATIKVET